MTRCILTLHTNECARKETYGCGWFDSLQQCADTFLKVDKQFVPNQKNVAKYKKMFAIYQAVYAQTKDINEKLVEFRR